MPYHFYKAVKVMHIRPCNSLIFGRWNGIKVDGLDPTLRNAFGGATMTAHIQTGRDLSDADASGVGQCLSGSMDYATAYCTTSDHVVLRITLQPDFLQSLVKDAATHYLFESMEAAVSAPECTAIARIPHTDIEYSTEDGGWAEISRFNNPEYKDWSD